MAWWPVGSALLAVLMVCGALDVRAQAPAGEAPALAGTAWRLVEFRGGDDTAWKPDDPAKYTIAFRADGRVGVRLDCNRGQSTWTSSGPGRLELGPLGLTRAVCPPGSRHDQIANQWPFVRSYVVRNGHLFLALMADGGIYEFEPLPAAEPGAPTPPGAASSAPQPGAPAAGTSPLESAAWVATELGGQPLARPDPNRGPRLCFEPKGRLAAADGCNRMAGSYEATADAVTFGKLAGTQMACEGTAEIERAFREALRTARRWRVVAGALELYDAAGARVARFEPHERK